MLTFREAFTSSSRPTPASDLVAIFLTKFLLSTREYNWSTDKRWRHAGAELCQAQQCLSCQLQWNDFSEDTSVAESHSFNIMFWIFPTMVQWDQSKPGNSASNYSDQSMIKLNFSAAWVVLDFSKEVPKIFFFLEISIFCDKNPIKWP